MGKEMQDRNECGCLTPYAKLAPERRDMVDNASRDARLEAVRLGCGCDKLIDDPDWRVRKVVAERGYGLEKLVDDPEVHVRWMVARQGHGLDKLVDDPEWAVRAAVAEQGYGLDRLIGDDDIDVRRAAREKLKELGYRPIDEDVAQWAADHPESRKRAGAQAAASWRSKVPADSDMARNLAADSLVVEMPHGYLACEPDHPSIEPGEDPARYAGALMQFFSSDGRWVTDLAYFSQLHNPDLDVDHDDYCLRTYAMHDFDGQSWEDRLRFNSLDAAEALEQDASAAAEADAARADEAGERERLEELGLTPENADGSADVAYHGKTYRLDACQRTASREFDFEEDYLACVEHCLLECGAPQLADLPDSELSELLTAIGREWESSPLRDSHNLAALEREVWTTTCLWTVLGKTLEGDENAPIYVYNEREGSVSGARRSRDSSICVLQAYKLDDNGLWQQMIRDFDRGWNSVREAYKLDLMVVGDALCDEAVFQLAKRSFEAAQEKQGKPKAGKAEDVPTVGVTFVREATYRLSWDVEIPANLPVEKRVEYIEETLDVYNRDEDRREFYEYAEPRWLEVGGEASNLMLKAIVS